LRKQIGQYRSVYLPHLNSILLKRPSYRKLLFATMEMSVDYFQGVVAEYLRADRACFINPEFFLSIGQEKEKYQKDKHGFVDVLAMHMKEQCAYLCEVTYARKPAALIKRLGMWKANWSNITEALIRDAGLPPKWQIKPWIFVPEKFEFEIKPILEQHFGLECRLNKLEETLPWNYSWDRTAYRTNS